jgi:pyridoxal phosphate enzyme (YggS family)
MDTGINIADRLASILGRVRTACLAAGRRPEEVTLVAVSKTHPVDMVEAAITAGQTVFGENRVAESGEKFPGLLARYPGAKLHLIGPLQTNKVKDAVALAQVIETLDRVRLADAIEKAAMAAGRCPELLVQVNIGDEEQKSGVATAEADEFIREMKARFGDLLTGVMCIPPVEGDPAPYFRRLASMADVHGLAVRSMGMSGDFETAIACGSTEVRVGSAIFGGR